MASRQSAAGHAASSSNGTPSSASSTSSIKPTGWIRSHSVSRPALGDRTNFPSAPKSTPLRSLPKPTVQSAGRRTTPATNGNAGTQQKLSSFFAPNTAPSAVSKAASALAGSVARSSPFQNSPSVVRARARSIAVEDNSTSATAAAADVGDDDLEARAASLLRGRFGSVSRSLVASKSSTPTRAPSPPNSPLPCVDPQPSRLARISASRRAMPSPQPSQARRPELETQQDTPPRPKSRHATQEQPVTSSPPFEPTLMQESLSNFTPLAWEDAHASRMAFLQRLAGVPKDEILRGQKANMADELAKAHARMQPRIHVSPDKRGGKRPLQNVLSPSNKKGRLKPAAALTSSPPKERMLKRPEAVLRSPRTNRRIYALETQLGSGLGHQRATSLQPLYRGVGPDAVGQRRTVSAARHAAGAGGASDRRQADMVNSESNRLVEEEEEESETQPLPWPTEDDEEAVKSGAENQVDETQPLAWDDQDEEPQLDRASQQLRDHQEAELTEVPPSDDEDLLLQNVISSSSSSSPSSSPSPSPIRLKSATRGAASPSMKPQRIKQEQHDASPLSNRLMRTPLQPLPLAGLPRVSPVSLTPSAPGGAAAGGSSRFDRVVAALKREERRQHKGAQLQLDSFISSSWCKVEEELNRRTGLSEDLQDVLSDDEVGDITVGGAEGNADETQLLPWSSPDRGDPQGVRRPSLNSSPMPTQRSTASSTSVRTNSSRATSSSAVSLPSEGNLDEAGNTQLRSFFHGL
ncbi:hypothetical protein EX895_003681 [Sporisorium graminicola]|uniref:Uncharacterized protein n=1 Tax=Sporisorium graminicola TaxID=280036 RepID=A0A4U7KRC4_9BASI|nr:hypothetical protein EX895_003681 [Sporisorium graminicola]TKY87004.1 hypothetical protein EX895_003681 [Sporisorium graminicola]